MESKNRKQSKLTAKTAVIAGIVLFSLLLPQFAQATVFESVGKEILYTFGMSIHHIFSWLVGAAASFFEGALNIGFKSHLDIVKIGWQVTRDLSNMFFILFIVVIAFATILRFEKYGIKKLLPKIIIIVLLINFSYVICAVIIDFSNITADFFIKDIKSKIKNDENNVMSLQKREGRNVINNLLS